MPGEIDQPIPDPASLARGRFTYFPVVPGRLEFAIEVRRAILRSTSASSSAGTARHAAAGVDAGGRPASGNLADLLPGRGGWRRRSDLRSGGAGRSLHRSHAHGGRGRRRNCICRSRGGAAPAPEGYVPRLVRHPAHRPRPLHRGLPRLPSAADRGDRSTRRRDRLEAAGSRSAGLRSDGDFAQPARSAARCDGRAAGAPERTDRTRRRGAIQPPPGIAGRNHRRVPRPAMALRTVPAPADRCQPDRPSPRPAGGLP